MFEDCQTMIVYTANYGGKDRIKPPLVGSSWNKDLRFVYFTDQAFESEVWNVVVKKQHGNSNRLAKWYKMHPHELFPGEPTIWVDSSIVVWKDPTRFFRGWDNVLLRKHPRRKDVYEEAEACILSSRDANVVEEQITEYERHGFPRGSGLYMNGILFRKPTAIATKLNELWWQQIERYSYRDQMSLPYVLWSDGFSFKEVKHNYFGDTFSAAGRHKFRGSKEI